MCHTLFSLLVQESFKTEAFRILVFVEHNLQEYYKEFIMRIVFILLFILQSIIEN